MAEVFKLMGDCKEPIRDFIEELLSAYQLPLALKEPVISINCRFLRVPEAAHRKQQVSVTLEICGMVLLTTTNNHINPLGTISI